MVNEVSTDENVRYGVLKLPSDDVTHSHIRTF
jgi:hypothetical protein